MRFRGILRDTLVASAALAAITIPISAILGQLSTGAGLAAGLLLGAVNGPLVAAGLVRDIPFVVGTVLRLGLLSAVGIAAAVLLGGSIWSVLLGVGFAQVVMVATSIRQGVRA